MIDYLLDQLSNLPNVRVRRMFGAYALYCDEKVVALVCDNQLFGKIAPSSKPQLLLCPHPNPQETQDEKEGTATMTEHYSQWAPNQ
jgi:TfoX/Sxy family transcriptional regulator of competence genes